MRFLVDEAPTTKIAPEVLEKCLVRVGDAGRGPSNTLCGQHGCQLCTGSAWEGLHDLFEFRSSACAKKFVQTVVTKNLYFRCVSFHAYKDGERMFSRGTVIPFKVRYTIDSHARKIVFRASHEGTIPEQGVTTDIMVNLFRTYATGGMTPLSSNTMFTITNGETTVEAVFDGGRKLARAQYYIVVTTLRQRLGSIAY